MSILDNHTRDAFQHDGLNYGVATRKPTGFTDNVLSAWDHDQTIYRINRENQLKMDLVKADIERYEELTGETLQIKDRLQPSVEGVVQTEDFFAALTQSPVQALEESLMERLREQPELAEEFELNYEDRVTQQMQEAAEEHRDVSAASTGLGKVGSVAGSLASGMWDPYILGASVAGGTVIGSSVSIGRGILLETIVGSAVETLAQPSIARQTKRAGEEYGWDDAVTNVVLSGVLSGGLYGSVRGGARLSKTLRDRASGVDRDTRLVLDYLSERLDEGFDAPFTVGSRAEALEHYNRIDEATNSLMQGRMIQPQHVDVSQISFNLIRSMDAQSRKLAGLIRDPEVRRAFEESYGEQRDIFINELQQIDRDILEAARQVEGGVAGRRMDEAEEAATSLQGRLSDLDHIWEGFEEGEPDLAGLARFAPDEMTEERMLAIARDLGKKGVPKKARQRLEAERDSILTTVAPFLRRNIEAEQRDLEKDLQVRQSARSMAANNVRQTPAYRSARRKREKELAGKVAALTARIEGGQKSDNPLQISYDMTPYRAMVREARVAAEEAAETAVKLEGQLPRVQPRPEAKPDETVPEVTQPPLYQTLAEVPDRPLALADPDTGAERLISARQVLDELDEDVDFVQAFKECRGG